MCIENIHLVEQHMDGVGTSVQRSQNMPVVQEHIWKRVIGELSSNREREREKEGEREESEFRRADIEVRQRKQTKRARLSMCDTRAQFT